MDLCSKKIIEYRITYPFIFEYVKTFYNIVYIPVLCKYQSSNKFEKDFINQDKDLKFSKDNIDLSVIDRIRRYYINEIN